MSVFVRIDVVAVAGFGLRAFQRAHNLRPGLKLFDRILEFAVLTLEAARAATGRGRVPGRSGVADRLARRGVRRGSAHERAHDAREENCAGEGRRGLGSRVRERHVSAYEDTRERTIAAGLSDSA